MGAMQKNKRLIAIISPIVATNPVLHFQSPKEKECYIYIYCIYFINFHRAIAVDLLLLYVLVASPVSSRQSRKDEPPAAWLFPQHLLAPFQRTFPA